MKKGIYLLALLALIGSNIYAQSNNPSEIKINNEVQGKHELKCKMTVEEVLLKQSFDIDHPKSEFAHNIATSLFKELNLVYSKLNNNETTGLDVHIKSINASIKSAKELGMNYIMFKSDLEFIDTIK